MSEVEPAVAQAVEKRARTFKHSALTGVSIEVAFGCHFGLSDADVCRRAIRR